MINANMEKVKIEGKEPYIMAEFCMIVRALKDMFIEDGDSPEEAKEKVEHAVKMGLMTQEKLAEYGRNQRKRLAETFDDEIKNFLKDLLKDLIDGEDNK